MTGEPSKRDLPGPRRAVVALGGNALLRAGQVGQHAELVAAADHAAGVLVSLVHVCESLLIVHGNGPQVGIELVRSEEASTKVPPFGLDLCVASTQGTIATLLETALRNAMREEGLDRPVASLLSLVEVTAKDPAFQKPTKPIGLFYSAWRGRQLADELQARGWGLVEDAGRGWRPVVPSPRPQRVLADQAVRTLLDAGFVVIAGGGGGVPVTCNTGGHMTTAEAVIDKDRTSALLAATTGADTLIFLTGVPWVELNYGTPFARRVDVMTTEEARRHLEAGQFPAGSMGPKVQAAVDFADRGGTTIITSAEALSDALTGRTGTRIIPTETP